MEIKVEKIGEEIKRLRKEYDISQSKLAKAAGLNINTVSRIERGITKMDLTTLSKLMKAF
jgi:transcriptional regulator with XRE-family HTH domain